MGLDSVSDSVCIDSHILATYPVFLTPVEASLHSISFSTTTKVMRLLDACHRLELLSKGPTVEEIDAPGLWKSMVAPSLESS
jgi:hypothetical protein